LSFSTSPAPDSSRDAAQIAYTRVIISPPKRIVSLI
jgi:hypothetical protein